MQIVDDAGDLYLDFTEAKLSKVEKVKLLRKGTGDEWVGSDWRC